MRAPKPGSLKYISVLISNELAPEILRMLRDSQKKSASEMRFAEICEKLGKSPGHVSETLSKLQAANMVTERVVDSHEWVGITAEGLKAIELYEHLENDTELESLPDTVKELRKRHGYPFLLPAQGKFLREKFPLSKSMIIMASPSAGKTFLAECCIFADLKKGGRILYITPFKALNRQKYEIFVKYLPEYRIIRTDGDTFPSFESLSAANIVVATYEKALMAMLRDEPWLRKFSLIVADEITLLSDEERGSSIDLLLSMLKDKCKLLTLSSHLHNTSAIKSWLHADCYDWPSDEAGDEYIVAKEGSKVVVENRTGTSQPCEFNSSVFEALIKHGEIQADSTMIVLVGQRAEAEKVALNMSRLFDRRSDIPDVLALADEQTPLLKRLGRTLKNGVVFHHAGLPFDVRESLEDLLAERKINVVVCTPTLSHGVDFPLDHVAVDWDTFRRERQKKIEYLQYRGRAARIGKSRGGSVYIFSRHENGAVADIREFLGRPVEDVFPPHLERDHFEWIVMLSCRTSPQKNTKVIVEHAQNLLKSLLAFRNPKFNISDDELVQALQSALKNLAHMRMLSIKRDRVASTKLGEQTSRIDWVPRDSYFAFNSLKDIQRNKSEEMIARSLLFAVCHVGLMKRLDRTRASDMQITYLQKLKKGKKPPKGMLRGLAIASVLCEWINEKPIQEILSDSTTGTNVVHDEDIRKFASYASVEMRKIAILAETLEYGRVAKIAGILATRLRRGIKEDLVSEEPAIDLSRLEGIGRARSRRLYNLGLKSLLDIYRLVFKEGEGAFVKKSKLPPEIAGNVIEQLRILVQSDSRLAELCKNL